MYIYRKFLPTIIFFFSFPHYTLTITTPLVLEECKDFFLVSQWVRTSSMDRMTFFFDLRIHIQKTSNLVPIVATLVFDQR